MKKYGRGKSQKINFLKTKKVSNCNPNIQGGKKHVERALKRIATLDGLCTYSK